MTPLRQRDFVMRQVEAVAAMLARLIGLRTEGRLEEARAELERAYELLLGSEAPLVKRMDAETAVALIGVPEKAALYARLLGEEAAQTEDPAERERLTETARLLVGRLSAGDPSA
ncbi:MAG: hypothetical protein ACM3JJ_09210 [Hyphomicrobiales bacterium]